MIGKSYSEKGFSLLEILIAFSILAFSLSILLNIFSGGLRRTIISEEYQQAVIIAQSKLAAAGVESGLEDVNAQGQILDKYFWSIQVQPFDLEKVGLDAEELKISPYHVIAKVEWSEGSNDRQVELTTLKLAKQQ